MRNTKQKKIVLNIINSSYNHPTAYMVYQECVKVLPNISLGTVYRNLNMLVELGKIRRLDTPNQMTRYDKIVSHDHFICLKCGKIKDLERSNIVYDEMIGGNKVLECKINYEGVCCDCLKNFNKGEDINGIKGK